MTTTLIQGAKVWDATGAPAFEGDVLVEGNKIRAVGKPGQVQASGAGTVVDGKGKFLMPGMVEGHGHISFDNITATEGLILPPPEEHTLTSARLAKLLFDQGFTSVYSASEAKLRLAVAVRNHIDAGHIVGPRIRAGSLEISVTGAMGDEGKLHDARPGSPSHIVNGPEEMRAAVRLACREGCDNIKLDVSGDPFYPNTPSDFTPMAYDEIKMAVDTAHAYGKMVNAHTRSVEGTKRCLKAGVDMIYHCEFSDPELLDMMEEAKDRVFVAPSFGLLYTMMHEASGFGISKEVAIGMGISALVDASIKTHTELRKRGIRHVIGGDYGIAWNPQGTNARDLKYFVDFYGYSPEQALMCATRNGGLAMRKGGDLGTIKENQLADLLLVNGNPIEDISIMTNKDRLVMIMKDGQIYKNETNAAQRRVAA